jgi:hypothetical protein
MALILKFRVFVNGAEIPARHTCKGDDVSCGWRIVTSRVKTDN